ncbi:MAG: RNA-directed DNA polymerase [Clostridia bacterium]|nr:RNA-directed DNA polymerase [Clostridia bacterium]
MTNQERIQARIARDKARKAEKRKAQIEQHGTFTNVITMQALLRSLQRRRKDVEWKGSVQSYIAHAPVKMKRAKDSLWAGRLDVNRKIKQMTICERGKKRNIHAIMIDSRVIQGALCDSSITPLTQPSLIYDNPASTKGKGVSHARRRIVRHIEDQVRQSRSDFYALVYDFSGFFDSISHSLCRRKLAEAGQDEQLQALTMYFIKMYQEQDISLITDKSEKERLMEELRADRACGATLGSQISQDMALVVPNELDHAIKDKAGIRHYIRYMDDGNILHADKDYLRRLLKSIKRLCAKLGLKLNEKKTRIVKATRGFTFLKVRYTVTETGRIIKKMAKSGIVRMRRKLKKFRKLVDAGLMTRDDAFNSFKSWFGNAKTIAHSYRTRKAMLILYNRLFNRYRTGGLIA